ncbi:MAG: hypothetical protein JXQ25_00020 [Deltaproteobacteria bacterium]|nr:hypothetical protein [Deltaproteobacteria bacterium]
MLKSEIDELLREFTTIRTKSADPELPIVEAALFIEECFGLRLSEDEINNEMLGSQEALRTFIYQRLGIS